MIVFIFLPALERDGTEGPALGPGCQVCVETCPDDALKMVEAYEEVPKQKPNWEFSINLPNRGHMTDRFTLKGSQFLPGGPTLHRPCVSSKRHGLDLPPPP